MASGQIREETNIIGFAVQKNYSFTLFCGSDEKIEKEGHKKE